MAFKKLFAFKRLKIFLHFDRSQIYYCQEHKPDDLVETDLEHGSFVPSQIRDKGNQNPNQKCQMSDDPDQNQILPTDRIKGTHKNQKSQDHPENPEDFGIGLREVIRIHWKPFQKVFSKISEESRPSKGVHPSKQ